MRELIEVSHPTTVHSALGHMHMLQLSKLPPRHVVWGDGSDDEMCASQMMSSATT
ncbi:hypothetical protein SAMN04488564_10881 [Lentzea waywayandensis]|uniref:Uncharacterized protein n=1 Tax=Lentzea waywayandensis TaxID=84724 RepID=A0A1I6F4Y3_9PSEU|nr:hypothetical protein [Lentzea waywayandensis]SFR24807.1 hypothetical protein SAMN04488564_10881 [Lentzea waywayandensis]